MKLRKVYALIILIVIMLSLLCGCNKKVYITTGLKSDEIFKLSGNPCSTGQIMLILMAEKNRYESDFGSDIWQYKNNSLESSLEEEIKEKVKTQLVQLKTIELLGKENKILLSDEEKELIKQAANEYYSSLTDKEKELLKAAEEDVQKLYTSFYIADKLYDKLTKDIKLEVSDEEARVIKCKYIFIDIAEGKENALEKANTVHELLVAGNDFNAVAKQYSSSEEVDVQLSRNIVYSEFKDDVFALTQGQISDVVENEKGYYIFLCVSDYLEAETLANKENIVNEYKKEQYQKIYKPFEAEQTFEFNDKFWEKVEISKYKEVQTINLYEVYNEYFK